MQIVIDIPDIGYNNTMTIEEIIMNGIILPSNCGRLIDERDFLRKLEIYNTEDEMDQAHYRFCKGFIACMPTVIPAQKKENENES